MAHMAYMLAGSGSKLVITWHSDIIKQKFLLKFYHPFLKKILDRADSVIATSDNYIRHSPYLSKIEKKCSVIPLGISLSNFKKNVLIENETGKISKKYGSRPIILFVGRLSAYKGLNILIDAMNSIEANLLIVGEGDELENIKSLIKKNGLLEKIHLCGNVKGEILSAYYYASQVLILPSVERSEAYGIVQLEAMACEIPVVSTNLKSGVPFINIDRETGIIIEPNDVKGLSVAINELLGSEKMRREFGKSGRERVEKFFTLERMLLDTKELYNRLG